MNSFNLQYDRMQQEGLVRGILVNTKVYTGFTKRLTGLTPTRLMITIRFTFIYVPFNHLTLNNLNELINDFLTSTNQLTFK